MLLDCTKVWPLTVSVILHSGLIAVFVGGSFIKPTSTTNPTDIVEILVLSPQPERQPANKEEQTTSLSDAPPAVISERVLASLDAPPAPTAEEWKLASTYTLKNSKRYRYAWAQQVRSMMGTAIEGPDQGMVRFEIEIDPTGRVVRVDTIWSTSEKAETLARAAIANLPALPPTPTGKPLIFEKTISFQPFETGWPPIYKYDCIPDPPKRPYPWAWDGVSTPNPPGYETVKNAQIQTPQPIPTECPDAPEDSIEAEAADMQRQFDMWESGKLDQRK